MSYRILYQDATGLGGEVKWDGENERLSLEELKEDITQPNF
jgi:hypothetical protein